MLEEQEQDVRSATSLLPLLLTHEAIDPSSTPLPILAPVNTQVRIE